MHSVFFKFTTAGNTAVTLALVSVNFCIPSMSLSAGHWCFLGTYNISKANFRPPLLAACHTTIEFFFVNENISNIFVQNQCTIQTDSIVMTSDVITVGLIKIQVFWDVKATSTWQTVTDVSEIYDASIC
jgi:hypothetical protein